jgi:hypothetical protein
MSEKIESLISKEALAEFAQLKALADANLVAFEKLIATGVQLNNSLGRAVTFKEVVQGTKELAANEKLVVKQSDDLAKSNAKLAVSNSANAKQLTATKLAQQELNKVQKERIKLNEAEDGSIAKLSLQLTKARRIYDSLGESQRNSAKGKELLKFIQDTDSNLKKLEGSTGRFQRKVGDYEGSAKIIVDAFEKAQRKVGQLNDRFGSTSPEARAARHELDGLQRIVENPQFLKVSANFGDATQETRFFQKQLANLEVQGLGNTDVAKELKVRLAELTDTIADTRAEVKALSSDTRSFDLFASSISFVASAFQATAGAAIALGASEEDTAEATKNLVAIENVANGVRGIANELTTRGTAANKVYAFAQLQVKTALDTTSTSAVRLRAALITVGIGALIIGVGLLIANFGKLREAFSGVSERQKKFNDTIKEAGSAFSEASKNVSELKINIDLAKQGFLDKDKVVKQYNETMGKAAGQAKSLEEVEKKLIEQGEAYIQVTLLKAAANIALEKAAQKAFEVEEKRRLDAKSFLTTADKATSFGAGSISAPGFVPNLQDQATKTQIAFDKEQSEKRKQAAIKESKDEQDTYENIARDLQKKAAELAKANNINFFGTSKEDADKAADLARKNLQAALEILKRRLKDEADFQKKLSESELVSIDKRIEARNKAFDLEKRIILAQKAFDITEKDLTEKQKANIADEANSQRNKSAESNLNDLLGIYANFRQKQKEMFEADVALAADLPVNNTIEEQIEREERAFEKRSNFIEEDRDILIRSIEAEKNAKLSAAKTDEERQRIEEKYNKKRVLLELETNTLLLQASLDLAEKKLQIAKGSGNENQISDLLKQIAELKRRIEELKGVKINIDADAAAEKLHKLAEGIEKFGRIALDIFSAIGGIISANIDREKNAIQDQINEVDKKKEKEIEAVNAQTLSEEEKANKIAIINTRAQAQKDALERRQRQLDQQKAKFDKARAITEAVINTAVAVIRALPNIALAAVVGGIGALQLAAIIATPIPKFATGTDDAPGGPSWVGDGGKKELVVTPDGKLIETPALPTIMNIPKHSVVYPDSREVMESGILSNIRSLPGLVDHRAYYKEMTSAITGEIKGLGKIIKNKTEVHIHKKREGWGIMKRQGGNQTSFLNNNLQ